MGYEKMINVVKPWHPVELPISPDLGYHGLHGPSPKLSGYTYAVPQVLHAFDNLEHKEMHGIVGTRLEIKLELDILNFKMLNTWGFNESYFGLKYLS